MSRDANMPPDPLSFVTFYIDVTSATMDDIHRTTSTITVTEPHRYIRAMFASARRFHPRCRLVILSDARTAFPPLPEIEIVRYPLDAAQPMRARSIAWLRYLEAAAGHTIFLDCDILINGDLAHVFDQDFAVALTYRAGDAKWPINAGLNFAHGRFLAAARAFHQRWLRDFRQWHDRHSVWGGDQDALRELFAAVDFARDDSFSWRLDELDIRFLPCAIYNFSTARASDMTGEYPRAKALHFKGRRKPFMLPYWARRIAESR